MAWYGPAGSGKVRHSSTVWSGVDRRGGVGPGMVWQGNGCINVSYM